MKPSIPISKLVYLHCLGLTLFSILLMGCASFELPVESELTVAVQSLDQHPLPAPNNTPLQITQSSNVIPPTRIVASKIDLDSEIVPVGWQQQEIDGQLVSQWNVADFAAGWHLNSAMPGQIGNIVLSGHHNIQGEVFRYIENLEAGDEITLYRHNEPFIYKVTDKLILKDRGESDDVRRANARWIGTFEDERLTLITCWPYNNNTHRLVVVAKPQ
ncbi:MAG: sortase [Chloroflexota bacterium]